MRLPARAAAPARRVRGSVRALGSGLEPPGGRGGGAAMSGLARAVRRVAPVGLAAARHGESGGGRRWGWGLALGLALGVKAAADGGPEEVPQEVPRRGFGAAIERSRDLLRRIKVPSVGSPGPGAERPRRGRWERGCGLGSAGGAARSAAAVGRLSCWARAGNALCFFLCVLVAGCAELQTRTFTA